MTEHNRTMQATCLEHKIVLALLLSSSSAHFYLCFTMSELSAVNVLNLFCCQQHALIRTVSLSSLSLSPRGCFHCEVQIIETNFVFKCGLVYLTISPNSNRWSPSKNERSLPTCCFCTVLCLLTESNKLQQWAAEGCKQATEFLIYFKMYACWLILLLISGR
jgi:hypothetical protein